MQLMEGLSILSGINKDIVTGQVTVSMSGIVDDEHDPVFHGGPDKAILGCSFLLPPVTVTGAFGGLTSRLNSRLLGTLPQLAGRVPKRSCQVPAR